MGSLFSTTNSSRSSLQHGLSRSTSEPNSSGPTDTDRRTIRATGIRLKGGQGDDADEYVIPSEPSPTTSLSTTTTMRNSSNSVSSSRPSSPFKLPDFAALTLHSPNSQIVGTPFATNCASTPFEYPFPAPTSPVLTNAQPSSRPPSPGIPAPPGFASTALLSDPTNAIALSLAMGVPSSDTNPAPTPLNAQQHKMRMATAPVPPGLMKRRRDKAAAAAAEGPLDPRTVSASTSRRGSAGNGDIPPCGAGKARRPQRPPMPDTGLRVSDS